MRRFGRMAGLYIAWALSDDGAGFGCMRHGVFRPQQPAK
jgi:hypothetical protein